MEAICRYFTMRLPKCPSLVALPFLLAMASATARGQSLPGTQRLEPDADFSATMVAGIDKMALRLIVESRHQRQPTREKLQAILGMVDERVPVKALELLGTTAAPALLAETATARIFRVRWPVFAGVHGEGIYIQPKGKPIARVICIPDADELAENMAASNLGDAGVEGVIMALVDTSSEFSTNEKFGIRTNIPHREWIYRQSYELGRHIIGYEVQKALSLVDWFKSQPLQVPLVITGVGEGGLVALSAAAIDERIDGASIIGYFGPRESVWQEPIYRNVFGLLRDFGDAEIASLVAPRPLALRYDGYFKRSGPPEARKGVRIVAAPFAMEGPTWDQTRGEVERLRRLKPGSWVQLFGQQAEGNDIIAHVFPTLPGADIQKKLRGRGMELPTDPTRQERLVRELEAFTQRLLVTTEKERHDQFWKPLPLKSLVEYEAHTVKERQRFWNEVIGRLPDPDLPTTPRSRLVHETEKVTIHEVTLDVWQDVFAWGWLCLPNDLKPGERRPVIVCQHGLEGIPEDVFNDDPQSKAYGPYKAFALRLAEQGYITFAPHNPYRGKDAFRTLQRKLNPLGLTLYSVINGQHQRILEWLKAQPFALPEKIAFYGLSYGGKSAMRTPAVLTGYCLSICSGDFNEWVRKCVSIDMPMSYIHVHEYEIWEWNMGRTFNYAEMAALIAPRPFMVERGHNDGVGIDEWVNYEFAKVRRLYNKLQIGDRTTIEHFDGPHTINGVGTFEFLAKHLK